jgi:hypothetical protein
VVGTMLCKLDPVHVDDPEHEADRYAQPGQHEASSAASGRATGPRSEKEQ